MRSKRLSEAGRHSVNEKFLKDGDNDTSLIQLKEEEFEGTWSLMNQIKKKFFFYLFKTFFKKFKT